MVASVTEDVREIVTEYVGKYEFYHLFETPNLHWLSNRLAGHGYKICFMAEYFLPDINNLRPISCDYEMRVLEQQDFEKLYLPEWSNALCRDRKHLDLLGVGAYEDEKLIGLAGCSADCERCGRLGWMYCQNIGEKELHLHLPADWLMKYLRNEKFHFTAPHGQIFVLQEML